MLENAGISGFEESVLRALLSTGQSTVTELAEQLDAPHEAVRRAVRRLVEAGVAQREGAAVAALDPLVALQPTMRRRHAELEQLTRTVDELSAAFHDRVARGTVAQLIEPVAGRAAIAARLAGMLSRADSEVLAFDTPPYAVVEYTDSDVEIEVLARKIRCRAVYAAEVLDVPQRAESIRALVGLGEEARVVPHVPVKLMIVDHREVLMPLSATGGGPPVNAVVVHKSELCDALVALFESVWARGVPLFSSHGESEAELPVIDHAILQLLNAGLTDDVIARQLNISERTVRRRVSELAARLGAGSRFQIGAQAARRGWV